MTFRNILLAGATTLAAGLAQAHAQTPAGIVDGLYIGGGIGANWWHDQVSKGYRLHDNEPFMGGYGALGYGFGNGLRAELEGNYRSSEMAATYFNGAKIGTSGDQNSRGVMANLVYDLDLGLPVTPYVGGGVGYAWQQLKGVTGTYQGTFVKVNDTNAAFAWQAIGGASYDLGGGLAMTLEYRYFAINEMTYGVLRSGGNAGALPSSFKMSPENHSVMLGLRYAFNAAPAAAALVAAPAAAPVSARTYLVFFDWDKASLTDRAKQIVAEAADASRKTQTTRIDVGGYTDTSGTAKYNMGLSRRRADAVAAELVRRGVPKGEIFVTAFGETHPLVPTADGVREPQNRRVEIILK